MESLRFLPSNTFFIEAYRGDLENLWEILGWRIRGFRARNKMGKSFSETILHNLAELYIKLDTMGIRKKLMKDLSSGGYFIFGFERPRAKNPKTELVPAFAFITSTENPSLTELTLRDFSRELATLGEPLCFMTQKQYAGCTIHHLARKSDPFQYNDILLPSYVILEDMLIISNSLPFLERIIDVYVHRGDPISYAKEFPALVKGGKFFIDFDGLRRTFIGLWMLVADLDVDTSENRRKIRIKKEKEFFFLKNRRSDFEEFISKEVQREIARLKAQRVNRMRRVTRFMEYLKVLWIEIIQLEGMIRILLELEVK
jgi:hypothetical protein